MIRVDMEYPYPCVPQPGITEEKDGGLVIITASHVFRIRNGGNGSFACSLSELLASGKNSY